MGYGLSKRTRISTAGKPFRRARLIKGVNRLPSQTIVACDGVGDQSFDAPVADVLELLVVGRVCVGLMGSRTDGSPADLPDLRERGVVALEACALLERICGEPCLERVQANGLGTRCDIQLKVAPGAPPKRPKGSASAAVQLEDISSSERPPTVDLITISFMLLRIEERFCIVRRMRAPLPPVTVSSG